MRKHSIQRCCAIACIAESEQCKTAIAVSVDGAGTVQRGKAVVKTGRPNCVEGRS